MIPLLMVCTVVLVICIICSTKEITQKQRHDNNNKYDMKFQATRNNSNNKNNNKMRGESIQGLDTIKCKHGRCAECICPMDLIRSCFKSYFKDMLFCKSTNCFCPMNSTGVGYYGPGSSNCKHSILCCNDCNPSSSKSTST